MTPPRTLAARLARRRSPRAGRPCPRHPIPWRRRLALAWRAARSAAVLHRCADSGQRKSVASGARRDLGAALLGAWDRVGPWGYLYLGGPWTVPEAARACPLAALALSPLAAAALAAWWIHGQG